MNLEENEKEDVDQEEDPDNPVSTPTITAGL